MLLQTMLLQKGIQQLQLEELLSVLWFLKIMSTVKIISIFLLVVVRGSYSYLKKMHIFLESFKNDCKFNM